MHSDQHLKLWCPFNPAINQYALIADRNTLIWARKFNLLDEKRYPANLQSIEFGWFAGRTYPNASWETLQIASDWLCWLFMLDDECDEAGIGRNPESLAQIHHRLLTILRGATPTSTDLSFGHALYDLRTRMIAQHSSPGWLARFTHAVEAYFAANQWEAKNRLLGIIPSVATYQEKRPYTGAVYPCFELLDITDNINLPDPVRKNDMVQRLVLLASYVLCWCNDILSVGKERQQGDVHNLVISLQNELCLTSAEALQEAVRIHNNTVHSFIDLAASLPSFGAPADAELSRFIDGLRYWMRGYLDWSWTAIRYQHAIESSPVMHSFSQPSSDSFPPLKGR